MGMPEKYFFSVESIWMLKRASLMAPHAVNRKATAQPTRPKGVRAHV